MQPAHPHHVQTCVHWPWYSSKQVCSSAVIPHKHVGTSFDTEDIMSHCRCRDVMWALQRFGIRQVDSVTARAALARDEADAPSEWVLEVDAVAETQVGRSMCVHVQISDLDRTLGHMHHSYGCCCCPMQRSGCTLAPM